MIFVSSIYNNISCIKTVWKLHWYIVYGNIYTYHTVNSVLFFGIKPNKKLQP